MDQRQQQQCVQKSQQFHVEIRKQNLSKIFGLKRIKPMLIESDQEALCILSDGVEMLKSNELSQEMLLTVLKSISSSLRKYEFHNHHRLINDLIQILKKLFDFNFSQREIVKEAALEIFVALSLNNLQYGLKFGDVPFEVLTGYNIQMIISCLITLSHMLMSIQPSNFNEVKTLFSDINIYSKLLMIHINFAQKKEVFDLIKKPFLCCAIPLCYIDNEWLIISKKENDFKQLLKICVNLLEDDVVKEGEKDETLRVFFQKYYQTMNVDEIFNCANELAYPFGMIEFITKIVREVNVDVLTTLTKCMHFQITTNSIQRPLVKCIIKIFSETEAQLEDDLKEEIFAYIFGLEYSSLNEEANCLRELILLAINHSVNNQTLDESIFKYTGNPMHTRFPKTCHLLQVMEYLEIKEDDQTQSYLMELIENYLTCNGSFEYLEESLQELAKFRVGRLFLEEKFGFQLDEIEDLMDEEYWAKQRINVDVEI